MNKKNKICIVIGTRPEIIKMSPVIKECIKRKTDFFIIHTGQHYSFEMDQIFMKELSLPKPKYNLSVGSATHAIQTAKMLEGIETILIKEKPTVVLVQGDTNSVLSGAIAASKLHIKVGHIEAGLRSYDKKMPEEANRVITDHISDYLFVPTVECEKNLKKEGIFGKKVINTGNTIVDAVISNIKIAKKKSLILKENNLEYKNFLLVTSHRAENVDTKETLEGIIDGLILILKKDPLTLVWPMHPRTISTIKKFSLISKVKNIKNLKIIQSVGYFDSLMMQYAAKLVLTDSGGLQEESCILGTPCITLRENTERPESVSVGANILVGTSPKKMLRAYTVFLNKKIKWKNPFGKGDSAKRIIDVLEK